MIRRPSHPFDGAHLKIRRARRLRAALRRAARQFRERYPYQTYDRFDPRTGEQVSSIRIPRQPPVEWGLIVGDAIHNLRAALDHAAFALAWQHGTPTKERSIQFPICDTLKDFRANGERMIAELSPRAQAHINQLQPYHGADQTRDRSLILLRDLDNTDKHRVLHLVMMKALGAGYVAPRGLRGEAMQVETIWSATGPLEDGAELARWRVTDDSGRRLDQAIRPSFAVEIAFANGGPAQGRVVSAVLAQLEKTVRDIIAGLESVL